MSCFLRLINSTKRSAPCWENFSTLAERRISIIVSSSLAQDGAVVFITFRTADSIPREVLLLWEREKQEWMQQRGVPKDRHWRHALPELKCEDQRAFRLKFDRCREEFLDSCHGECLLRDRELATIVADSLMYFDGKRYTMGDFVIMPNHVHLLSAFRSSEQARTQCTSWLHFTAVQINQQVNRKGTFWQSEPFDHLVRSPEQYTYLRTYIANNGPNAKLPKSDYLYRKFAE